MKIRNKKTGEIVNWEHGLRYRLGKEYHSIAAFEADWEDVPAYFTDDQVACIKALIKANHSSLFDRTQICIRQNVSSFKIFIGDGSVEFAGDMPKGLSERKVYDLFDLGIEA